MPFWEGRQTHFPSFSGKVQRLPASVTTLLQQALCLVVSISALTLGHPGTIGDSRTMLPFLRPPLHLRAGS